MDQLALSNFTGCLSKAGLAIGGTASKFKIAAPNGAGIDFCIEGVFYHKADADNLEFSSGHTALAASQNCVFLVQIDADGDVSTKQGNIVSETDLDSGANSLQCPLPDADNCPIGSIKVKTSSSGTFTPGTTNLSDAQVTEAYKDFGPGMPRVPETS